MIPEDTTTPAAELLGTNVPEFHAMVREAVEHLCKKIGDSYIAKDVTIYRTKSNRRQFYLGAPRLTDIEPIVTIKVGAGWEETTSPLTHVSQCVMGALGYYWRPVSAYFAPHGPDAFVYVAKGKPLPKGGKLIVTAKPHPAGLSK